MKEASGMTSRMQNWRSHAVCPRRIDLRHANATFVNRDYITNPGNCITTTAKPKAKPGCLRRLVRYFQHRWYELITHSLHAVDMRSGCPCLYTTPCSPQCTCAHPMMSAGCSRCAKYGSLEQRRATARRLATILDAAHIQKFTNANP